MNSTKCENKKVNDIVLWDRKQEFIGGNKTVWQEDCNYDFDNNKAICTCKVKEVKKTLEYIHYHILYFIY